MTAKSGQGLHVGADIGGTFTDVVVHDSSGNIYAVKVSSTPNDYASGVLLGIGLALSQRNCSPNDVTTLRHATTVAANTILENKGARTALVTTEGFRDVLEMRRLRIPELYNLRYKLPPPLVPRRYRYEVAGRMGPDGQVLSSINQSSLERVSSEILDANVESVAICLLHSYANDEHELEVAEALRQVLGDSIDISLSSVVLPEIREYGRSSTTVVNAYLSPSVTRYIKSLLSRLKDEGYKAPLKVMQSNGGLVSAASILHRPAYLVESGPAGGVMAAAKIGGQAGEPNLISLDMGGTTAKVALVEDGLPAFTTEYEVGAGINTSSRLADGGGYPVQLPFIDLSEIGAGGGSLVTVDSFGVMKVGPESAGAEPGPACYGLGNDRPTLTDALVTLGYLSPTALLGGLMPIDGDLAKNVIREKLAEPLGLEPVEAAHGVFAIAVANMTRAVKAVSTYRGRDPRDFVMISFGGNGPIHGVAIARGLGIRKVIIPRMPGVLSALGLLLSDTRQEYVQTVFRTLSDLDPHEISVMFDGLATRARAELQDAEEVSASEIKTNFSADCRYIGQAFEVTSQVDLNDLSVKTIREGFIREHLRTYGHASETDPVQLVNLRVSAIVESDLTLPTNGRAELELTSRRPVASVSRDAFFGKEFGTMLTPVVSRIDLRDGVDGPLIVEEYDSTTVVPPNCFATLDGFGNIVIEIREVQNA